MNKAPLAILSNANINGAALADVSLATRLKLTSWFSSRRQKNVQLNERTLAYESYDAVYRLYYTPMYLEAFRKGEEKRLLCQHNSYTDFLPNAVVELYFKPHIRFRLLQLPWQPRRVRSSNRLSPKWLRTNQSIYLFCLSDRQLQIVTLGSTPKTPINKGNSSYICVPKVVHDNLILILLEQNRDIQLLTMNYYIVIL